MRCPSNLRPGTFGSPIISHVRMLMIFLCFFAFAGSQSSWAGSKRTNPYRPLGYNQDPVHTCKSNKSRGALYAFPSSDRMLALFAFHDNISRQI